MKSCTIIGPLSLKANGHNILGSTNRILLSYIDLSKVSPLTIAQETKINNTQRNREQVVTGWRSRTTPRSVDSEYYETMRAEAYDLAGGICIIERLYF